MEIEKLAFVCDDPTTLSSHFGRAPLVVVVTLEDGREVAREARVKERPGAVHRHEHHENTHERDHQHHHTHDHSAKLPPMADCDVTIVRGAGDRAGTAAES